MRIKNNILVKLLAGCLLTFTFAILTPSQQTFAQGAGGGSGGGTSNPYVYKFTVNVWDSVNGHVANGVSVKWSKGSANGAGTTNSSGAVTFGARDAGYYSISATKGSCGTSYSSVTIGANNPSPSLQLYLSYCPSEKPPIIGTGMSKYTISGTVKHITDNKPVGGFTMTLYKVSGRSTIQRGIANTLSNGKYSFPTSTLEPGDYKIKYEKSGWNGSTTGNLTITNKNLVYNFYVAKSGSTTINPAPKITNTITGTILLKKSDGTLKALTGTSFTVKATNTSGQSKTATNNTSQGTYTIAGLNNPSYTVTLAAIVNKKFVSASSQSVTFSGSVHKVSVDFIVMDTTTTGNGGQTTEGNNGGSTGNNTTSPSPVTSPTSAIYTIKGQIYLQQGSSKKKYTGGGMNVTATNVNNQHKTVKVAPDGTYAITGLSQKQYTVSTTAPSGTKLNSSNNVTATFTTNATTTSVDFTLASTVTPTPTATLTPTPTTPICLQVITYARNSTSHACQTFPDSCLPDGWIKDPTCETGMTPSPSPSVSPTVVTDPTTMLPSPTVTLIPTATLVPSANTFVFTVFLHGIGNTGDSVSPGSNQANSAPLPLRQQKQLTFEIINDKQEVVVKKTGVITYNPAQSSFTGTIDAGKPLVSGSYIIKVKIPQYLKKQIGGIQTVVTGQSLTLPPVTFITGDIDNNNHIDILDYNILIGCYSDLKPAVSCVDDQNQQADINDDGKVNQFDYNLFLRELSVQPGN